MAVLANIRKKPIYLIIIIGLALFAFVISGIFTGNEPSRSTIGSVNGEDISNEKFSRLLEAQNNRTSSIQVLKTFGIMWLENKSLKMLSKKQE